MSVKHVKSYYKEICEQYKEMLEDIKYMEEEVRNSIVSPERLKQMEDCMQPLMRNYERISYIIYLLNMPDKPIKQKKYKRQYQKQLEKIPEQDKLSGIKSENSDAINAVKSVIKKA